jgi:hypothetical protein
MAALDHPPSNLLDAGFEAAVGRGDAPGAEESDLHRDRLG